MALACELAVMAAVAAACSPTERILVDGTGASGTSTSRSATTGTGGSKTTSVTSTSSTSAGSGGAGGAGGGAVTATSACAAFAHAYCKMYDSCSTNSFLNQVRFGSEAECEARMVLPCPAWISATGSTQTPAGIQACAEAIPNFSCPGFLDGALPMECLPPAGTVAVGAACGAHAQCASGFCDVRQYAICGVCQPSPTVGAPCTETNDCGFGLGLTCDTEADAGCVAYATIGNPCLTGSVPCQAGYACVGDDPDTFTFGTCESAGAAVGDGCDATRATMANCDPNQGLVCAPGSGTNIGTCQDYALVMPPTACGASGSPPNEIFSVCAAGGLCHGSPAVPGGHCLAPAADGMPCGETSSFDGPICLPPAVCVLTPGTTTGTCTLPNPSSCM